MGTLALSWAIAAVAALVAAVSAMRVLTTGGAARFAAGGDLLMGLCMAAMALPATAAWYGGHGMVWAAVFALLGLGGAVLACVHARAHGWRHGRHWVHLVVGSAGMVIMTLAMTTTSAGPVLALGHSHGHGHGSSMAGMPTVEAHASAGTEAAASSSVLRIAVAALAVYFLWSIAVAVWARIRGTDLNTPTGDRESGRHRKSGTAPEAALVAHVGMGGTMSAMLLMMVV